jgi:glutathione S-transferase
MESTVTLLSHSHLGLKPTHPLSDRYALNFKKFNYRTHWVEFPDVTSVRKSLGAPPSRYHPDGTPFYTMPVLQILSTGEVVGDTFDIALYLDKMYPDNERRLIPEGTVGLHRALNKYADGLFTPFYGLYAHGQPLNDESKRAMLKRVGFQDWDEMNAWGEKRAALLVDFEKALGDLDHCYVKKEACGPFLEGGDKPTYGDMIIGGWLQFMSRTVPEWDVIAKWHGGRWGEVLKVLEEYAVIQ